LNRALMAEEQTAVILARLSAQIEMLGAGVEIRTSGTIEDLPAVSAAVDDLRYLPEPELPEGSVVALTGDRGSGKSALAAAWSRMPSRLAARF
jgi:ABC-type glutathione transport system ATPase component